jgi:hypothetical protein
MGRGTNAGSENLGAAGAASMLYTAGRSSYRLGKAKETTLVRTFSSSLTVY